MIDTTITEKTITEQNKVEEVCYTIQGMQKSTINYYIMIIIKPYNQS